MVNEEFVENRINSEKCLKNLNPTIKRGRMIIGCVSSIGVGNLEFIEGNMNE